MDHHTTTTGPDLDDADFQYAVYLGPEACFYGIKKIQRGETLDLAPFDVDICDTWEDAHTRLVSALTLRLRAAQRDLAAAQVLTQAGVDADYDAEIASVTGLDPADLIR